MDSVRVLLSAGINVGSVSDMGSSISLCLGLGAGLIGVDAVSWTH